MVLNRRKMATVLKTTIVSAFFSSMFVECRKDKVFCVICEIGLKAYKSQIIHCSNSNRMLSFVRHSTRCIKNVSVRRSIYLTLVRSHLGYARQVWGPQSIELVYKMKQIQGRASKCILNLQFHCQQSWGIHSRHLCKALKSRGHLPSLRLGIWQSAVR